MHFVLLLDTSSTDECTGRWCRGSTPKDELPEPRGSLANDIPSHAIEQVNQKGSTRRLPFTIHVKCIVISVYLNSESYLISYTRLFMKLNLFETLHLL